MIISDRECARPDCNTRFVPKRADARYCEAHRGKHAARDASRARSHKHICLICGEPFTANDSRQLRCGGCAVMIDMTAYYRRDPELDRETAHGTVPGWTVTGISRELRIPANGIVPDTAMNTRATFRERYPFTGIDGEGITRCKENGYGCGQYIPRDDKSSQCECGHAESGHEHIYVLLGCGSEQREWPDGVRDITEIFSFLYDQYRADPSAVYCGFYLGYDFNMWLRLLPRERAWLLLTKAGRAKRKRLARKAGNQVRGLAPWPVEYKGWEFDILAFKRFKLRPRLCDCKRERGKPECKHRKADWMYINDAGPFFQCSLLKAVNPDDWTEPVITTEEYETLKAGKERRASAGLDDTMRAYNRLENDILARLLTRYDDGLQPAGVNLSRKQWFGPGQAAQTWMHHHPEIRHATDAVRKYGKPLQIALIASYTAGWFEIPVHGIVPAAWAYDINSAYPYVMTNLPCTCGTWKHGKRKPAGRITHKWLTGDARTPADRKLWLVHVTVRGNDKHLGPLQFREKNDTISRPLATSGWYWEHEISAARKAGLISETTYHEYWEYTPCDDHRAPLRGLAGLYEGRLRIGKNTPQGKAYKLIYNAVYGKFAQSTGDIPPYANPMYASLITSGCRMMILHAIASHPEKSAAVCMVATDGVFFMSPHPSLPLSKTELGHWEEKEHRNLTLFKQGVYWDDDARQAIADGKAPQFKARGINAADFARSIDAVDKQFRSWGPDNPPVCEADWPSVSFRSRFTQYSVRQALAWSESGKSDDEKTALFKRNAGHVVFGKKLAQKSYPDSKRWPVMEYDQVAHRNAALAFDTASGVWRSQPWKTEPAESKPYGKSFGLDAVTTPDESSDQPHDEIAVRNEWAEYVTPDSPVLDGMISALGVG